ncbi:superoxide dismutase family protein [Bacillus sp. IB182487]|uniref:Superoxide dismutase family protein n=2 Tax=Metabacillus arenae TaxID=2771434 RepID=A0A926RUW3_9BACI|nr:superoxide dismutase family protein [Metabacillus arenae]
MIIPVLSLLLFIAGCNVDEEESASSGEKDSIAAVEQTVDTLEVKMMNENGRIVGKAIMNEINEGVLIEIQLQNVSPGKKAIHIHENASCVKPSFESAGAHFNPYNKEHGFKNPHGPHAGDLPNIEIGADGKIDVVLTADQVTLQIGKENSLLDMNGSALIVHENSDDYSTDPSGNSGERLICGEISG